MPKKLTTEEFIEKANQIHNNKYNYSKVEYVGSKIKVIIICPIHGEFEQIPNNHLNGIRCPKCYPNYKRLTLEEFIERATKKHGSRYDYNLVNYIGNSHKIEIICKKHGSFWQNASSHLMGFNCPECNKLQIEKFIEKSNQIHNNKYDYSKVKYVNSNTKVKIICPEHGEFEQSPSSHLKGYGCIKCKNSLGENIILKWLIENKITYIREESFKNTSISCKNPETDKCLRFDFYLPEYNLCIEYDGVQHYEPFSFNSNKSEDIKLQNFQNIKFRDNIKTQYCKDNGIKLIRIPYFKFKNIEKILKKELLNE